MKQIRKPMACLLAFIFILGQFAITAQATTIYIQDVPDTQDVSEVVPPAPEPDLPAGDDSGSDHTPPGDDTPTADEPPADLPANDANTGNNTNPETPGYDPVPDAEAYLEPAYIEIAPLAVPLNEYIVIPDTNANTVDWSPNFMVNRSAGLVQLNPGEVWTDKSLEYLQVEYPASSGEFVYDGTARITIYVWGRQYERPNGEFALLGDPYNMTISTWMGDFVLQDSSQITLAPGALDPSLVTLNNTDGRLTFTIPETHIIDSSAPLRIQYVLELEDRPWFNPITSETEDWQTNTWYSTVGSQLDIRFYPGADNPIYFGTRQVTEAAFSGTLNWNNGSGMNSATIRDVALGKTITFGANVDTPERQLASSVLGNPIYWANNATVPGDPYSPYSWHLNWEKGGAGKVYIITVRGLARDAGGIPLDVTYELLLSGAGGNTFVASSRVLTSEVPFRMDQDPDGNPLEWDETGRLVFRTPLIARIRLERQGEEPEPTADLEITKEILGEFGQEWYFYSGDWAFTMRLMLTDGRYVLLHQIGPNEFEYSGAFTRIQEQASILTFSGTDADLFDTITIRNLPTHDSDTGLVLNYILYEFFTFETLGLITVEYAFDGGDPDDNFAIPGAGVVPLGAYATSSFTLIDDQLDPIDREVTIRNTYDHGIGFIEVTKITDGFPHDWEVEDDTVFYVRIFDLEADNGDGTFGNYILFFPEPITAADEAWLPIWSDEFIGTYWAVGNHELGLTHHFYADLIEDGFLPILELPVSTENPILLSNLWTGLRYEVREVRRVGTELPNDPNNVPPAADWAAHWASLSGYDLLPRWFRGFAPWEGRTFTTDWVSDDPSIAPWELVPEIPPGTAGDSLWHNDLGWKWGVIYPRDISDEFPEFEVPMHPNPTNTLQFGVTASVTITNRFKFHCGTIQFLKELCENAAAWGMTDDTPFYARVYTEDGYIVVFVPHGPPADNTYRVIGFLNETLFNDDPEQPGAYRVLCPVGEPIPPNRARTIIPFRAGDAPPTRLIEVPTHPFRDPLDHSLEFSIEYNIVEVFPTEAPPANLNDPWLLPPLDVPALPGFDAFFILDDMGLDLDMPFEMEDDLTLSVTIRNEFEEAVGNLVIQKEFDEDGNYEAWGVDGDTPFYAVVYREDEDDRLAFWLDEMDGAFVYWDYTNPSRTRPIDATPVTVIPFTANDPALIVGLTTYYAPADVVYEVFEVNSSGILLPNDGSIGFTWDVAIEREGERNLIATVTNEFPEAFTVTYDGNGHTGGVPPTDGNNPYAQGATVTVLGRNSLVRTGFVFTGWNTAPDGTGTTRMPGSTFPMPGANVVLYAQWAPAGGNGGDPPEPPPGGFFVDEHIWYIRGYDILPSARVGVNADGLVDPHIEVINPNDVEMRPNNDITRAEVAMVFFRLLRPEFRDFIPDYVPYADVNGDEWFGRAVATLTYWNIFQGHNGAFRPHVPITRGELAAVVSRFDTMIDTTDNPYTDVFPGTWEYEYILSATARGWFVGFPDGTFRARANLSRAEFVTAVNRVLERKILLEHIPDDVVDFIDMDGTHWAHADFMEAAHSHDWEPHENGISERWLAITGHGLDNAYNE